MYPFKFQCPIVSFLCLQVLTIRGGRTKNRELFAHGFHSYFTNAKTQRRRDFIWICKETALRLSIFAFKSYVLQSSVVKSPVRTAYHRIGCNPIYLCGLRAKALSGRHNSMFLSMIWNNIAPSALLGNGCLYYVGFTHAYIISPFQGFSGTY